MRLYGNLVTRTYAMDHDRGDRKFYSAAVWIKAKKFKRYQKSDDVE